MTISNANPDYTNNAKVNISNPIDFTTEGTMFLH